MDCVKRFYLSSFLHIVFYSGFYLIYLQSIGLSKIQMGLLMSLSLILVALLEVPTGIVADKISKKVSVLLSKILTIPSVLSLGLAHSFWGVLLSTLFGALSLAFLTGAETGWLYELLKREGNEKDYPRVYGRLRSFEMVGGLIGTVAGGLMAGVLGMRIAILLTAPFIVASLSILATVPTDRSRSGLSYGLHLIESLRFLKHSPKVILLVVYANFIGMSLAVFTSFMQLYFYGLFPSVTVVSWISAFYTLVSAVSWYVNVSENWRKVVYSSSMILVPLLSFISGSFISGLSRWLGFVTLVFGTLIFAQAFKEWQARFQASIPDEKRATIGSFYSLTAALTSGLLNVLLGWLFDLLGIMRGILIVSIAFLIGGACLLVSMVKRHSGAWLLLALARLLSAVGTDAGILLFGSLLKINAKEVCQA